MEIAREGQPRKNNGGQEVGLEPEVKTGQSNPHPPRKENHVSRETKNDVTQNSSPEERKNCEAESPRDKHAATSNPKGGNKQKGFPKEKGGPK